MSLAAAAKAEQAQEAAAALDAILGIHRQSFPLASPVKAPLPAVAPIGDLLRKHRKAELADVGFFQRARRSAAKARARQGADMEHAQLVANAERQQRTDQIALDEEWQRLRANDPESVMAALAAAFEDNDAEAAPLGVEGNSASVVVQVPDKDAVPERMPSVTTAGNLSLRKMTKRQTNDFYNLMVCGFVVATVKEAFAVCPGLTEVAAVAVRRGSPNAYGHRASEAVVAARFTRKALDGILWAEADAIQVLNDASLERLFIQKGAAGELQPLDVASHPEIGRAMDAVDLDPA